MATRSTISVIQSDGSVKSIYCHWDGYIKEGVGDTLKQFYNTLDKANELIELGSLSSLWEKLTTDNEHSFELPEKGVTVAYHRDRGEELVIEEYESLKRFNDCKDFEDYNYLFENDVWLVSKYDNRNFKIF